MTIPQDVQFIISSLRKSGFLAYAVGGCVRDMLLSREPHDWDICTNATPNQIQSIFSHTIPTGIKHGTVTVVLQDNSQYEVTTFRKDGLYTDSRHPDSVEFVGDVRDDLSRRDFTINAMAYDSNELIDPFNGQNDLSNKLIRCVGNPSERFAEDPLRILRALRFASAYEFHIDSQTSEAMQFLRGGLSRISYERIYSELSKLLQGKFAAKVLKQFPNVICEVIPEMSQCVGFEQNNPYHIYDVYQHILCALDNYKGTDLIVKWALFLHDIGKPDCYTTDEKSGHFHGHPDVSARYADQILHRLRVDNHTRENIVQLVKYHDVTIEPTHRSVKRCLNKLGLEQFERLLEIKYADISAHTPGTQEDRFEKLAQIKAILASVLNEQACFSAKDLAVNGYDLMEIGIPAGIEMGNVLKALLEKVLDGDIENEKTALMEEALRQLNSINQVTDNER